MIGSHSGALDSVLQILYINTAGTIPETISPEKCNLQIWWQGCMLPYQQTNEDKFNEWLSVLEKKCVMFTILGGDIIIMVAAVSARITVYELH